MVRPGYNNSSNKKVIASLLCCVVVTLCADRRVLSQLRSHQQSGDAGNALAGRSWCVVTSSGKRPVLQHSAIKLRAEQDDEGSKSVVKLHLSLVLSLQLFFNLFNPLNLHPTYILMCVYSSFALWWNNFWLKIKPLWLLYSFISVLGQTRDTVTSLWYIQPP